MSLGKLASLIYKGPFNCFAIDEFKSVIPWFVLWHRYQTIYIDDRKRTLNAVQINV